MKIWLISICWLLPQLAFAAPVKDWTLLVFLNGHNDLDAYAKQSLLQMEKVGSGPRVNVVVQWASITARKTKRIYVTKGRGTQEVVSPVVEELDPVDMGSADQLVEFVRWAKERYPARHYFLALWGHGGGWHRVQGAGPRPTDISWDDRFQSRITTKDLGAAMGRIRGLLGKKLDAYGSDACLMAMAEVAAEMKASVEVVVGSQENIPDQSWPYDQWLAQWGLKPEADAAEVATWLVAEYLRSYTGGQNGQQEVTLSALRMSEWGEFEKAFRDFSAALKAASAADRAKALRVAGRTQAFFSADYKDLFHFTEGLKAEGLSDLPIASLQAALTRLVLANATTKAYARARGLSIWLPDNRLDYDRYFAFYRELEFNRGTAWEGTLARLIK